MDQAEEVDRRRLRHVAVARRRDEEMAAGRRGHGSRIEPAVVVEAVGTGTTRGMPAAWVGRRRDGWIDLQVNVGVLVTGEQLVLGSGVAVRHTLPGRQQGGRMEAVR